MSCVTTYCCSCVCEVYDDEALGGSGRGPRQLQAAKDLCEDLYGHVMSVQFKQFECLGWIL